MKKLVILFVIGLSVMVGHRVAYAQSWFDPAWNYRNSVTISNPGQLALTNYQVRITLDSSFGFANAKSDGSDIRVTTADGTTLVPFWIETWSPSTQQGSIWVKVPTIPLGGASLFLYYGNPNPGPPAPVEVPPTGPFIRAAGNPINPIGDPGNGIGLLAENIVYDNVTGHYWMVFSSYRNPPGVGLIWSDNPSDPASWHWYGNIYTNPNNPPTKSFAPCLLKYNGTWYLFWCDYSGPPWNPHNIVVATAARITGPFTTPTVVLRPDPGTWENWRVDEPYVFQRDDGKWIMIYMADESVDNVNPAVERVGYAYADNILGPYTKYAGNPILDFGPPGSFDAGTIADPWVVEFQGTYYIGYTVSSTPDSPWQTAYATTTDWQTFTKHGVLLPLASSGWDSVNSFRGAVTRIGNTYVFSYTGGEDDSAQEMMGIATQPAVGNIINNPDAVFDFYDGFDGASLDSTKWSLTNGNSSQAVESGGQLTLTATSSSFVRITSQQNFGMDYLMEVSGRHPQQGTANMVAEFGLISTNWGDIVRLADDYPPGLSGSTTHWTRQAVLSSENDDAVNWWNVMAQAADQQWHTFRIYRRSPNIAGFQIDGNPVEEVSSSDVPTSNLPPALVSEGSNNQFIVDWIRVRKFTSPEPVATLVPSVSKLSITSLSPSTAIVGGNAFSLAVNGSGFMANSVIRWNGSNRTTTFVSGSRLTTTIMASDISVVGTAAVTVLNPDGTLSNSMTFQINNPVPSLTSLSPSSAIAGSTGFTLTVMGTSFISGSVVRWNGADRTTTFLSATQLTAAITAGDIAAAGTAQVTVSTPAPGGGTSNSQTFTISNPAPTITGLSPSSTTAGSSAFTLTVTGTNFVRTSVVRWGGSNRTTTYVSATQLTAAITAADIAAAGTVSVTVFNPTPGGGTSSAQTFTINNPAPTTTSLSPSSAAVGGPAFTLTVTGTNFVRTSVVRWGGSNRTTTYVNATQLTASIPASDIATAGTVSVTVFNPAPGGGNSAAQNFVINTSATPTITSLSPSSATAGGSGFTLTVNGSNYVSGSVVQWNGSSRPTTFVSATRLTAAIAAADIAVAGTINVTVLNPGGVVSGARPFTINNPAPTLTRLSPSSATAGGPAFTLSVNGTGFISSSVVRWNGADRVTTWISATQLTAAITAADIAAAGTAQLTVFTPAPGGGTSNAQTFTIQLWFDPGWNYRLPVTISNPGPSSLTDYQVQITLNASFDFAKAKSDGSDVRITKADGVTLIPFWIETWSPSTQQGSIWVKVPTIPTGGTTVSLYYGNPNATNIGNNPDAVFAFYDGFGGTSLDSSKWSLTNGSSNQAFEAGGQLTLTATNSSFVRITSQQNFGMGYIVEARGQHPQQGTANMVAEFGLISANWGDIVRLADDYPPGLSGSTTHWTRQAVLSSENDDAVNWSVMGEVADQQWHTFRIYRRSPNVAGFQIDGNPVEEVLSSDVPTSNLPPALVSYTEGSNNQFIVDWIRVRKFASPEPVATF